MKKRFLSLILLLGALCVFAADPIITIPRMSTPPKLDGKLSPGEWDNAASVSMLGNYNSGGSLLLQQQPVFYYGWDDTYLYVAMDSRESSANAITAFTTRNDFRSICGDDCVEMMFAGGTGEKVFDADFPTCYIVLNPLGTVWDAKFKPQRNECHNTWQSGVEFESGINGTRWVMEARILLKNISLDPVKPGTRWRANFSRTFFSYQYAVLNPSGALNDARIGADMIFTDGATPVRLSSAGDLTRARLKVPLELVNNTEKDKTFEISLNAVSRYADGETPVESSDTRKFTVPAGKRMEASAGNNARLLWINQVELTVKDENGEVLLYIPRKVPVPCQFLGRSLARDTPPVSFSSSFLLSKNELHLAFNARHWLKRVSLSSGDFAVLLKIMNEKKEVVATKEIKFGTDASWMYPTRDLPEGYYTLEGEISLNGKKIQDFSDWFEKKTFPWMTKPTIDPDFLPAPYTPVTAEKNLASVWGRSFHFGANGLPDSMITQGREYLTGPSRLLLNGKEMKTQDAFRFTESKPVAARGESLLTEADVKVKVSSVTEYDGFVLFRVTCSPEKGKARVDRLQLKIPLNDKLIKFHSASGDTTGVSFMGRPVPQGDGRIYDSVTDSRSVVTTPSFASLYWVADNDVSFCFAADSDEGWALRKDFPAVEAVRKDGVVELTVNLIDRPVELDGPRTMEFALQTGPTKPLPDEWRSFEAYPVANVPRYRRQIGGDGFTTHGGTHTIHPGSTPELRAQTTKKIADLSADGKTYVVGYQYWGNIAKGYPEVRAFRGEWGLSAESYLTTGKFDSSKWAKKTYGEDRNYYYITHISACPSYVDFLTWAYDETLKISQLYGFYDDVGYPHSLFRPEFGYGWVDEKGEQHYSTGLWLYRDRWKKAAAVNAKNNRLNMLGDSQRIHAHFMPAYAFIGSFAPCEQGYYNPFPEKDAYEFFGSLEQFAGMCPAKQFGQMAFIGLSSTRRNFGDFFRDSRTMFMLAAMHDQTLGSFGRREPISISSLIEARALFRAWEKGTEFTGYWQSADKVKVSDPALRVSYYTRPGCALFLLANTGKEAASFTVTPDMKKLGLDPDKVKFVNAETLETIPFDRGFGIRVAGHDIQMVLCGPEGEFKLPKVPDWDGFLKGGEKISDFKAVFPEGNSSSGIINGRHYLQGHHGGYAQAETLPSVKFPENGSVSALISLRRGNTCEIVSLVWENGSSAAVTFQTGNMKKKDSLVRFYLDDKGAGNVYAELNQERMYGLYSVAFSAVKIRYLKDSIEFYLSIDAGNWKLLKSVPRPEGCAGAPAKLVLGWGHSGGKVKNPLFRNVASYYDSSARYPTVMFFSNVSVAEEK